METVLDVVQCRWWRNRCWQKAVTDAQPCPLYVTVCHADALKVDRHIMLTSPKSPGKCTKHCPQLTVLQKCVHIGYQTSLHKIHRDTLLCTLHIMLLIESNFCSTMLQWM
jgi:hypothetical protein